MQKPRIHLIFLIIGGLTCGPLGGCGGTDPIIDGGQPIVEVGTGTTTYEPITEDQLLPLIEGPQGGHHFFMHVRMMGLDPGDDRSSTAESNPETLFRVFDADGNRVDTETVAFRRGYREGEDGWLELPSGRIIIVNEAIVDTLFDTRVRLRVEVRDSQDRVATDEVFVNAFEEPLIDE